MVVSTLTVKDRGDESSRGSPVHTVVGGSDGVRSRIVKRIVHNLPFVSLCTYDTLRWKKIHTVPSRRDPWTQFVQWMTTESRKRFDPRQPPAPTGVVE